jgi:hypothetical protein
VINFRPSGDEPAHRYDVGRAAFDHSPSTTCGAANVCSLSVSCRSASGAAFPTPLPSRESADGDDERRTSSAWTESVAWRRSSCDTPERPAVRREHVSISVRTTVRLIRRARMGNMPLEN